VLLASGCAYRDARGTPLAARRSGAAPRRAGPAAPGSTTTARSVLESATALAGWITPEPPLWAPMRRQLDPCRCRAEPGDLRTAVCSPSPTGPRLGAAQHGDFVPQHQQLRVLEGGRAAEQDQPAADPDEDQIAQMEGHGRSSWPTEDLPQLSGGPTSGTPQGELIPGWCTRWRRVPAALAWPGQRAGCGVACPGEPGWAAGSAQAPASAGGVARRVGARQFGCTGVEAVGEADRVAERGQVPAGDFIGARAGL